MEKIFRVKNINFDIINKKISQKKEVKYFPNKVASVQPKELIYTEFDPQYAQQLEEILEKFLQDK